MREPRAGTVTWWSGGQTGVDRALLDAAVAVDAPYGGWCPAGGWAEDFTQPPGLLARYPALRPTPSADPAQRTAWNVRDSNATLVLGFAAPGSASAGTRLAVAEAEGLGRPLLMLQDELTVPESAVDMAASITRWLATVLPAHDGVVNVAGPRESERPGAYDAAYAVLRLVIAHVGPP